MIGHLPGEEEKQREKMTERRKQEEKVGGRLGSKGRDGKGEPDGRHHGRWTLSMQTMIASQSLSIATPQTKLGNGYYSCQLEYLIDVSPKFHCQPASGYKMIKAPS